MAKNCTIMWTRSRAMVTTAPASPVSGDPVICGQIPGVALGNKDAVDNLTVCALDGEFLLSVKGETTTDAAVAVGDILYYDTAASPHKVNKDNTNGVRFGYAREAVGSGVTATIKVEIGY